MVEEEKEVEVEVEEEEDEEVEKEGEKLQSGGDEDIGGGNSKDTGGGGIEDNGGGGDEETRSTFVVELHKLNIVLGKAKVMPSSGEGYDLINKLSRTLPAVVNKVTIGVDVTGDLSQETLSIYEYMLMILSSPNELPVSLVALLLHPLCKLLTHRNIQLRESFIRHMEVGHCGTKFKDHLSNMCSRILQYLKDIVPEVAPLPCHDNKSLCVVEEAFSVSVNDLHVLACWGISNYGSTPEFALVRDSLSRLQELVWEQLIAAETETHYGDLVCGRIGEAMLAPTTDSGKGAMFSLQWLEEKDIVRKLLSKPYLMQSVPLVEKFLTALGAKGVVVKEEQFFLFFDPGPRLTIENCEAGDRIVARMLEVLDISTYSDKFLEDVLAWLEASKELSGLRIFNVLRKLLRNDKHKQREESFCTIFRKGATRVASKYLLECLNEVADHYNTPHAPAGSSEISATQMDDEREKVVFTCSDADGVLCLSEKVASVSRDQTKDYSYKFENWKKKEMDLDVRMNASAKLTKTLATTFPYTRHETAMKCLERVAVAQQLMVGLNECNSLDSVIATAMSPEFQAWETLKNESVVHSKVVQRVEELSKKHIVEYDALKKKQHNELVKFAQACRKEKEDVVWDSLYEKAKVSASVRRACLGIGEDLSSEDIFKRLLQHVGAACKEMQVKLSEVESKHKETQVKLSEVESKHKETQRKLSEVEIKHKKTQTKLSEVEGKYKETQRKLSEVEIKHKKTQTKLSEVEGKYKESQPNVLCVVCSREFSTIRKRACLDPCGHASACVECVTTASKTSAQCSLCKKKIEWTVPLPMKLYF